MGVCVCVFRCVSVCVCVSGFGPIRRVGGRVANQKETKNKKRETSITRAPMYPSLQLAKKKNLLEGKMIIKGKNEEPEEEEEEEEEEETQERSLVVGGWWVVGDGRSGRSSLVGRRVVVLPGDDSDWLLRLEPGLFLADRLLQQQRRLPVHRRVRRRDVYEAVTPGKLGKNPVKPSKTR